MLWELRRGIRIGSEQRMLLAALRADRLLGVADRDRAASMLAAYAETARNLVWVGVLYSLADIDSGDERQHGVRLVYAAVAAVLGLQLVVDALPLFIDTGDQPAAMRWSSTAIILRMTAAAGALVLVHNLYGQAAPAEPRRHPPGDARAGADLDLRPQPLHASPISTRRGARACSTGAGWRWR